VGEWNTPTLTRSTLEKQPLVSPSWSSAVVASIREGDTHWQPVAPFGELLELDAVVATYRKGTKNHLVQCNMVVEI
jgi:hypothetical protein